MTEKQNKEFVFFRKTNNGRDKTTYPQKRIRKKSTNLLTEPIKPKMEIWFQEEWAVDKKVNKLWIL